MRTVHQGMKRTDKKRKSDSHEETAVVNISTGETREPGAVSRTFGEPVDKVRKQGHLACTDIRTCEVPVESIPQAVFKPPAEYVATVIITVLHSQFWIHSDYYIV